MSDAKLSNLTPNSSISQLRDIDLIYQEGMDSVLKELISLYSPVITELYSDQYRILSEQGQTNLSNGIIDVILSFYGHTATNRLLTDMRVYRTPGAGRILERSGGFIPDILYTLHEDGSACHESYYTHLENDDTKYRVEFISGAQDLPDYVLSKLYPNCNYLIDVTLAMTLNDDGEQVPVSTVQYTASFSKFLLQSDIDIEHRNLLELYLS